MPWTVPADVWALRYLEKSLRSGRAAHAYLLSGPSGVGATALARQMAQALLCEGPEQPCGECRHCRRVGAGTHADVLVVTPTGASRSIGIDAVREVQAFSSLQPFEAKGKAVIIEGAEAMTREAANALLKLLEEPPPGVTLILSTSDEQSIPETVRSRCQPVRLRPLPFERVAEVLRAQGVGDGEAALLARVAEGRLEAALALAADSGPLETRREALDNLVSLLSLGPAARLQQAGEMAEGFSRDRQALLDRLELWTSLFRDAMLVRAGASEGVMDPQTVPLLESLVGSLTMAHECVMAVAGTAEALRRNANVRLAVEALLLSLPRERSRG